MKAQLRNHVVALFLLAPAAVTMTALPTSRVRATGDARGLLAPGEQHNGHQPGSRLRFTSQGTPNARAYRPHPGRARTHSRWTKPRPASTRPLCHRQRRPDRAGRPIRATLRRGNRTVTASYDIPADLANVAARRRRCASSASRWSASSASSRVPSLGSRSKACPARWRSSTCRASSNNVPLREVRPGHYEGSYTIRRSDRLNLSAPMVATLRAGRPAGHRQPGASPAWPRTTGRQLSSTCRRAKATSWRAARPPSSPATSRIAAAAASTRTACASCCRGATSRTTPRSRPNPSPSRSPASGTPYRRRDGARSRRQCRSQELELRSGGGGPQCPDPGPEPCEQRPGGQQRYGGARAHRAVRHRSTSGSTRSHPSSGSSASPSRCCHGPCRPMPTATSSSASIRPFPVPGTRYEVSMIASKADATAEARLVLFQRQG